MRRSLRQRQTLASFDYQRGQIPDGDAMLSDAWFLANVDRIVADELLAVERGWFAGRTVPHADLFLRAMRKDAAIPSRPPPPPPYWFERYRRRS